MVLSKPVSRPLRTLLPKAATSCSAAVSHPLPASSPSSAGAAADPSAPLPSLADHSQGAAYGKCIGARYTEVEKGMCADEFAAFRKCVADAVSLGGLGGLRWEGVRGAGQWAC